LNKIWPATTRGGAMDHLFRRLRCAPRSGYVLRISRRKGPGRRVRAKYSYDVIVERGDAEAGGELDDLVLKDDPLHGRPDFLGDLQGTCLVRIRQQDGELLTTHAADKIGILELAGTGRHGLLEHRVTCGVTIGVVDGLEVVEIKRNDAQVMMVAQRQGCSVIDLGLEGPTRHRTGETVLSDEARAIP